MRSIRRRSVLLVVVAAGLAAVAAAAATGAPAPHNARAHLALVSRTPVAVVDGSGFGARTRVTVTLHTTTSYTRHERTGHAGTFTATFPVGIDRCEVWSVTAVGTRGTVVIRSVKAPPECAPASMP